MSIVTKPHFPRASEPSRDDDPTGVHELLSSLPQPDPMPQHLVERINASLATEQAQRAARTDTGPVSPMVARTPHRPTRLVFAAAGAAAAVVLVAVVSSISFSGSQTTATSGAAVASTSSSRDRAESAPNADAPAPAGGQLDSKSQQGSKATPLAASREGLSGGEALSGTGVSPDVSALQIRESGARYTQAGFLAQAVSLHHAALTRAHFQSAARIGPTSTTDWLRECMSAIGAADIQLVEADVAFYEGQPAVIIVGMASGAPTAYVVAPQCSRADPAILRPATSLS